MSGQKDKDLEEFLQGDSDLSKRYQSESREQPPAYLDDRILAAAREATGSKPEISTGPFSGKWYVPVSLAAVLLLCVGLVVTMQQETGQGVLRQPDMTEQGYRDRLLREGHLEQGETEPGMTRAPTVDVMGKMQSGISPSAVTTPGAGQAQPSSAPVSSPLPTSNVAPASKADMNAADHIPEHIARKKAGRETGTTGKATAEAIMKLPDVKIGQDGPEESGADENRSYKSLSKKNAGLSAVPEREMKSPQGRLQWIRTLLDEGYHAQARDELVLFIRAYPDYPREDIQNRVGEELLEDVLLLINQ